MTKMNRRSFLQGVLLVGGGIATTAILKVSKQLQKETLDKADCFVALFNGSREVSGNGYSKVKMKDDNKFHLSQDGNLVNDDNVIFPEAQGIWGKITHFELKAISVKGNDLFSLRGTIANSPTISNGNIVQFSAGDLQIVPG